MTVPVVYLESYERDFMSRDPAEQVAIDRAALEIRRTAFRWKRGPLPLLDFAPVLRVHALEPGIWAADWARSNGRMTFSLDAPDSTGFPERLMLRRVGGHEIYADA